MSFIGQEHIIEFLKNQLNLKNRLVQSFLFIGEKSLGKATLAQLFSKSILCEKKQWLGCNQCQSCQAFDKNYHPDFFFLNRSLERNSLGIENAQEVIKFLSYRPQFSSLKIAIINEAEYLTPEAQNSLLKILEEPPVDSLIILITSELQRIRLTLLSRLLILRFKNVAPSQISRWLISQYQLSEEKARFISYLSQGRPGLAVSILADKNFLKEAETSKKILEKIIKNPFAVKSQLLKNILDDNPNLDFYFNQWLAWNRDSLLKELSLNEYCFNFQAPDLPLNFHDRVKLLKQLQKGRALLKEHPLNSLLLLENIFLT